MNVRRNDGRTSLSGRDGETRTPDPLLPKQVRYQLRHIPVVSMLPAAVSAPLADWCRATTVSTTVIV